MLYTFILAFISTVILLLPLSSSPIDIGAWIFLLTLTASAFIGLATSNWFGLVIFIIYIRGILVIFAYFVASAPNQIINIAINALIGLLIFILLFNFFYFNHHFLFTAPIQYPAETYSFAILFSFTQGPVLLFLAGLLLNTLICVAKVANRIEGPLRPFRT